MSQKVYNMRQDIFYTNKILEKGGIILYPTDTVWGIGCDATNADAIKKLYNIKKRPSNQPSLILVNNLKMLTNYVEEIPFFVLNYLLEHCDRPTTIIYQKAKNLPGNLLGQNGSIGIRIIKHRFTQALIKNFGKPIVSTSANFSGHPTPKHFNDISPELIQHIDYAVNRFRTYRNKKSSDILKIENNKLVKIR